jgi:hypothetical protein
MSELRALIEKELTLAGIPLLGLLDDGALFPVGWTWECGGDPGDRVEVWIMNPERALVLAERGPLAHVVRQMAVFFFQRSLMYESDVMKKWRATQKTQA